MILSYIHYYYLLLSLVLLFTFPQDKLHTVLQYTVYRAAWAAAFFRIRLLVLWIKGQYWHHISCIILYIIYIPNTDMHTPVYHLYTNMSPLLLYLKPITHLPPVTSVQFQNYNMNYFWNLERQTEEMNEVTERISVQCYYVKQLEEIFHV